MSHPSEMPHHKQPSPPPGLHLSSTVLTRLSGPVSMFYLRPTQPPLFFGQERTNLPLVLLWGDKHRDNEGMCSSCECNDKGEDCCYPVYDKTFLKELDRLATHYPVDFYTESSSNLPPGENKNILFRRFFHHTVKACHNKPLRSKKEYRTQCPTKNIRWHYADVRFFPNTTESLLFEPLQRYMPWYRMNTVFQQWERTGQPYATHLPSLHNLLRTYHARMTDRNTKEIRHLRGQMVEAVLSLPSSTSPSLSETNPHQKYMNLFGAYVHTASSSSNVLLKQMRKAVPNPTDSDALFTEFLVRAFLHTAHTDIDGQPLLPALEQRIAQIHPVLHPYLLLFLGDYIPKEGVPALFASMEQLFGPHSAKALWYALLTVFEYLYHLHAFFVDVYTVMRMMKPPEGSSSPYLVLGYFGAFHTLSIARILHLTPYFHYELVASEVNPLNSPSLRCLHVTQPIPLVQDLEQHARTIMAHPAYRTTLQSYKNILYKEEAGRDANELMSINLSEPLPVSSLPPSASLPPAFPPSISFVPMSRTPSSSFPSSSSSSASSTSASSPYSFPSTSSASSPYSFPSTPSTPSEFSPSLLSLLPSTVRKNGGRRNGGHRRRTRGKHMRRGRTIHTKTKRKTKRT